jgi:hypothetical protein
MTTPAPDFLQLTLHHKVFPSYVPISTGTAFLESAFTAFQNIDNQTFSKVKILRRMLEKSWPEISKGLGKELEVFSASDVPDSIKIS